MNLRKKILFGFGIPSICRNAVPLATKGISLFFFTVTNTIVPAWSIALQQVGYEINDLIRNCPEVLNGETGIKKPEDFSKNLFELQWLKNYTPYYLLLFFLQPFNKGTASVRTPP